MNGTMAETVMMPHGHCYLWRDELLWTHVISDGLIAAAYASIPAALIYLVLKRKELEFNWMVALFGVFILACGATHVLAIISVWEPIYYISAAMKVVTAAASVGTAIALWPLIPKIMAIPSPAQLQAVNDDLASEVEQHRSARVRLLEQSKELKDQAIELEAYNHQLSDANEMAKAYFDAGALEIQAPVGTAEADLIRVNSCLESGLVEDGKEIIGSIRASLRGVQRSVERLLAKASLSVWEPEQEEFELESVISELHDDFRFSGDHGNQKLVVEGNMPVVNADRIGLKLVMSNCIESLISRRDSDGAGTAAVQISSRPVGFDKELQGPAWEVLLMRRSDGEGGTAPSGSADWSIDSERLCKSLMDKQGGTFRAVLESGQTLGFQVVIPAFETASMEA